MQNTALQDRKARRLRTGKLILLLLVGAPFVGFVSLILVNFGPASVRGFSRRHESLPTATIEKGGIVYCRMSCCDFRFPLPPNSVVEGFDKVSGSFDTLDGSLRVTASGGTSFDMRGYVQLLLRHGFHAETADGTSLFASSTKPLGGSIEASLDSATTATIRFGYFGDY